MSRRTQKWPIYIILCKKVTVMNANTEKMCPANMSGTVQKSNVLPPFQHKINTFIWLFDWLADCLTCICLCYVKQCCIMILELSRGMVSHILLFILGALWYTMLIFRFPSPCTLRWYQRNNVTNRYNHKPFIISICFNTITAIQQISII